MTETLPIHRPFAERLRPAPCGGFAQDGWWVWCGSVARDDRGQHHCFAARWPQDLPFLPGYQSHSEIVRAVADGPLGPFRFAEVVLGDRGAELWDGRMTHNPVVLRWRDGWLLFYIGTTFAGPRPDREELLAGPAMLPWYRDIGIGVATAADPAGPWRRPERPLLAARPGEWDAHVVTNPSPCVGLDGRLHLYYRSWIPGRGCRLGVAIYEDLDAEPVYRSVEPLFDWPGMAFEDPYVFALGDHYEMLAKDLTGAATGELHACAHLLSDDGIAWRLAPRPLAYSRKLAWGDGSVRRMANIERPFLLHDRRGVPTHLYAAMSEGDDARPGAFDGIRRSWNGVVPLA